MNKTTTTPTLTFARTYRNFRALFIGGSALNIVLTFVPGAKVKVGGLMGVGGEEKSLSSVDGIRSFFLRVRQRWVCSMSCCSVPL